MILLFLIGLFEVYEGIDAELNNDSSDGVTVYEYATFIVVGALFMAVSVFVCWAASAAKSVGMALIRVLSRVVFFLAFAGAGYLIYLVLYTDEGRQIFYLSFTVVGFLIGAVILYFIAIQLEKLTSDDEEATETTPLDASKESV